MKVISIILLSIITLAMINKPVHALEKPTLKLLWSLEHGLFEPESVAYDPINNKLYITNVNGYTKNGKGYISRVNADGTNFDPKWVTGLNGPTGIIYHNEKLYFADIDALKVADPHTKKIVASFPAPNPKANLNDVAIDKAGKIYVSASNSAEIYKLVGNKLMPFIKDKTALKTVNGILITNDNVLISGGDALHAWNLLSKEHLGLLAPIDSPIRDIDGITIDIHGNLLLSLLNDPRIWIYKPGGDYLPLSETPIYGVDFTLHAGLGIFFIPQINTDTKTYRISTYQYTLPQ